MGISQSVYEIEAKAVLIVSAVICAVFCFFAFQAIIKSFKLPNLQIKIVAILMLMLSGYECLFDLSELFGAPLIHIFWTAGLYGLNALCWWFLVFLYWSIFLEMSRADEAKQKLLNVVHYVVILVVLLLNVFGYNFLTADLYRFSYYFQIFGFPVIIFIALLMIKGQSGNFIDDKKMQIQLLLLVAFVSIELFLYLIQYIIILNFFNGYTYLIIIDICALLVTAVKFLFFIVALALMVDPQNPIQQPDAAAKVSCL